MKRSPYDSAPKAFATRPDYVQKEIENAIALQNELDDAKKAEEGRRLEKETAEKAVAAKVATDEPP